MNYQTVQSVNPVVQNVNMVPNQIPNVQQPVTFQNMTTQLNGNVSQ